jgi:hypothetical protein
MKKPVQTIKLTDAERSAISKFLNVKTHTEFPKQQSEKFCRICNMLDNTLGKKEFTVVEFEMIKKEVEIAMAIINKKQNQCLTIIEKRRK